uniref:MD-2-related lipid-recognition domain-containing protein n=1 Tax=Anopheles farauti TaxID=69004 RepID=A0A9I3GJI0_9DIPT
MFRFSTLIVCYILIVHSEQHLTKRPLIIKRLNCGNHPKVSKLVKCSLLTSRNQPQVIDVLLDILEPTAKLNVKFNLYTQHFHTKNLLYGTTFEYCELVKYADSHINPVTRIALYIAQRNFPHILQPCPLYGLINVTSLVVDSKLVPPYAPQGSYYFDIRASNKRNQTIMECTSEFLVTQKLLVKLFQ